MKYECTSQFPPHTHTHTKLSKGAALEAKGSQGGANWGGNRNGEGEKGAEGDGDLLHCPPRVADIGVASYPVSSEKYNLKSTKSEKYAIYLCGIMLIFLSLFLLGTVHFVAYSVTTLKAVYCLFSIVGCRRSHLPLFIRACIMPPPAVHVFDRHLDL